MPVTRQLPQIPHSATPVLNPDGTMNREWYAFFDLLRQWAQAAAAAIP